MSFRGALGVLCSPGSGPCYTGHLFQKEEEEKDMDQIVTCLNKDTQYLGLLKWRCG